MADQLADQIRTLRPSPLHTDHLERLESRPGIYELYVNSDRVYVGKSSKNVPERLRNHLRKLSGRLGIDLADVRFICLYVDEDLEAAAPEKLLIKKYRDAGGSPWNTMGFGNKDPGRNRDHSLVKAKHFDAQYPIDLEHRVHGLSAGVRSVQDLLLEVKTGLPYNLRYEKTKPIKRQLADSTVELPSGDLSVRDVMRLVIGSLPDGWQATALPGYLILYHEEETYQSALTFWRKETGEVREYMGERRVDEVNPLVEPEGSDQD